MKYCILSFRIISFVLFTAILTGSLSGCGSNAPSGNDNLWGGNDYPVQSTPESTLGPTGNEVYHLSVIAGDIIRLGGYDWRVLDIQEDKALLLSVNILFNHIYDTALTVKNPAKWEVCEMREYLNDSFYEDTFSLDEKEKIVESTCQNNDNPWFGTEGGIDTTDKVFLLSLDEVVKYFGDSGQLNNRPNNDPEISIYYISDEYNSERIAVDSDNSTGWWWLRSLGESGWDVAYVNVNGNIIVGNKWDTTARSGGVRPAMWLCLNGWAQMPEYTNNSPVPIESPNVSDEGIQEGEDSHNSHELNSIAVEYPAAPYFNYGGGEEIEYENDNEFSGEIKKVTYYDTSGEIVGYSIFDRAVDYYKFTRTDYWYENGAMSYYVVNDLDENGDVISAIFYDSEGNAL